MEHISKDEWFSRLESLSVPFQRYGFFLPEQRELLERVYDEMTKSERSVWLFVAPTASGKTHAICLLARILCDAAQCTAILVPNNYLKEDFKAARSEVCGGLPGIDILNVFEYLKTNKQYDFVLADEAHNLKSFLEFDRNFVKNVDLSAADDELYVAITSRYLSPNRTFVAQQISFSSAKDLLDTLTRIPKFARQFRFVVKNPTLWFYFIYIWRDAELCTLKLVRADSFCKLKLPNKHMLMFSASPLSNNELNFYCGIPANVIERAQPVKSTAEWREKQRLFISVIDDLTSDDKIDLILRLIQESKTRTLTLFNNFQSCQKTFTRLSKRLKNVFLVPRGSAARMDVYDQFMSHSDGVLLTSSTVFWEGITVRNLKLAIITEPPYPRPSLMDLVKKKVVDGRPDMIRRLQQGLGRVARRKGEWGLGLMLFDVNKLHKRASKMVGKSRLLRMRAWDCPLFLHKIFDDKTLTIKSAS